jgi:AAA domain
MQLQTASKKKAKIKMALQGPSGAGKTKSALLIAYGICGSWDKIAVIDTENHSADLYADMGNYNVVPLAAPFTPERYILAIDLCLAAGIEVIILDSISHEWEGSGGILDIHSGMIGNSFTNWSKLTPRHNSFVQHLLQCDVHVIGTIRAKQEYVLSEKNGKQVPEKVGLKGITRDGMDYEFTVVLDINQKHQATASKDRTGLFMDKPEFIPTVDTGSQVLRWCNTGTEAAAPVAVEDVIQAIHECTTIAELSAMYYQFPSYQESLKQDFSKKKDGIINSLNQQKQLQNETATAAISN